VLTEYAQDKLGLLGRQIADLRGDARCLKKKLDEVEREIERLDAERWQLILTS
jgi:hypothetical protein